MHDLTKASGVADEGPALMGGDFELVFGGEGGESYHFEHL